MHHQKDAESSVDVLLEELHVNFVSASAILTLFAADLERRRTCWPRSPPSLEIADGDPNTSTVREGRSFLISSGTEEPTSSGRRPGYHHQAGTGANSHDRSSAQRRAFCRSEAGCWRHRTALQRRSPDVLYTPKVWRYVMTAVQQIPEGIFKRLSF